VLWGHTMNSFKDMKSLYGHIEKNALEYISPHQIGNEFKVLRDKFQRTGKEDDAKKSQWEMDCFYYIMEEGNLEPFMTLPNENGEIVEIPTIKDYEEDAYLYFIERLNSTNNPLLMARYAQLLWNSPKKHAKYARLAVDAYLNLVNVYEEKDKERPEEHYGLEVLKAVKNAFFISRQSRYRVKDVKSKILNLIKKFNPESSSLYALKFTLVKLMLQNKRVFKRKDYAGIPRVLWKLAESLIKERNFHQSIEICELGERINQKTGRKTHNWRKRIAESYEALLEQVKDKQNIVTLFFCEMAIESYKKIGNKKKVVELTNKYSEIKGSMKFAEFRKEIDLSNYIKQCKDIAKNIALKKPEEIIQILMHDKSLLPDAKEMEKEAEELKKQSIAISLIPEIIFDQSGHPAQHFNDDEEKNYLGTLRQYKMHLEIIKIHLIREIILNAVRKKKLNTRTLLDYIKKNSWYGKTLTKKVADSVISYNWLNLLAPSIDDYFRRLDYFLITSKMPDFVLPIDSLALKIEGLIRDICRSLDIPTTCFKKDKKGRNIAQERDLHALLSEDKIKELINEDDLLFLKFLLVEKAGYNLRHKVAHSLMDYREYSFDLMNLLFLALLRIGKYDFVKEDQTNPTKKFNN